MILLLFVFKILLALSLAKTSRPNKALYPEVSQPCAPNDSCGNRCIKDSFAPITAENVTLGQLNCYCDGSCEVFKDCCWDYHDQCDRIAPAKHDDAESQPAESEETEVVPSTDAFQCIVVHQFSRGSYWMINKCQASWPDDEIARRCADVTDNEFPTNLPVLGDTGWTYRNAYCAQCNYVKEFKHWKLKAQCVRSAPEEVLKGDPEMLSYYLQHFCNLEVKQDQSQSAQSVEGVNNKDTLEQMVMWRRSLRPCERNLIDYCPDGYKDSAVKNTCGEYQSIVLAKHDSESSWKVFKNPACAACHGYSPSHVVGAPMQPKQSDSQESDETTMKCPVWIASYYYDQVFWSLDMSETQSKMLGAFSYNFKTSYWVPPSFSVLMHFREDGSAEIIYDDGNTSAVTIPPQESCNNSQIYDPFYGTCRLVVCSNGMELTETGCVSTHSTITVNDTIPSSEIDQPIPIAPTLTVTVEFPAEQEGNLTDAYTSDLVERLTHTFEKLFNSTAENVTVHQAEIKSIDDEDRNGDENKTTDTFITMSVSFVILSPSNYTDEFIIEIVDTINEMVTFQKMIVDSDSYRILVVETISYDGSLICSGGSTKVQYNSSQYELHSFDGSQTLYVASNDMVYTDGDYQLLDYQIKISNDGVEYGYMEESRAVVCVPDGPLATLAPCNIYLPLNESEYTMLENSSLWLMDRDIMVPPEKYVTFDDGYAVCVDGYMPTVDPGLPDEPVTSPPTHNVVPEIISWISFGLTIFSLVTLLVTFGTYCIFKELRSVAGCNIMNLTVALFLALLTFLVGVNQTQSPDLCTAITVLLHYLFLATFFWNNVMAYDVWLTFGQGIKQTFRRSMVSRGSFGSRKSLGYFVLRYMAYAWGMPAFVVGVCLAVEFASEGSPIGYTFDPRFPVCWISNAETNILAFGVPLGIILLVNGALFGASIVALRRANRRSRKARLSASRASAVSSPKVESASSTGSRKTSGDRDNVFTFPVNDSASKVETSRKPRRRNPSTSSVSTSVGQARINIVLYIKMSTVMGFTWAIGFAAAVAENEVVWYIFELSVPLQGVFIFAAFICKRRVFALYRGLCRRENATKGPTLRIEKARRQSMAHDRSPATASPGLWSHNHDPLTPASQLDVDLSKQRARMHSTSSCDSTRSLCCPQASGTGFFKARGSLEHQRGPGVTNPAFCKDANGQG